MSSVLQDIETVFGDAVAFLEHNGATAPATDQAITDATTTVTAVKTAVEASIEPLADKVVAYVATLVPGGTFFSEPAQAVLNLVISKLTGLPTSPPSA